MLTLQNAVKIFNLGENSVFLSVIMKDLYLFNPENDMALACGSPFYMAPASIKKMCEDLAALPAWYAPTGSGVLLAGMKQVEWMEKEYREMLDINWINELKPVYRKIHPWGWNASLLRYLKECGFEEDSMVPESRMQNIRQLSGRHTSVEMLPRLRVEGTIGESCLLTSLKDVKGFLSEHESVFLKSLWSGSGKGVRMVKGELDHSLSGWLKRIISTHGAVEAEPFYDKVVDFAMEFFSNGNEVKFVGYSLFETDKRGIYKGNVLATNEYIESELAKYLSVDVLYAVKEKCIQELGRILHDSYIGYLGVDMMVCRKEGHYLLHPCVEINLRMNMGVVSRLLYDKFVCQPKKGTYFMEYYPEPGNASTFHDEMKKKYPLELEGGRICRGYASLTPVFDDTLYQIFILIK